MTDTEKGKEGCKLHQFERNNYFFGKLMMARDFQDEQAYLNGKRYLINRHVLGWGIVCGFQKIQVGESTVGEIIVTFCDGGVALDCCGREIVVPIRDQKKVLDKSGTPLLFDKAAGSTLCIYLRYRECYRERVEAASSSSGCEPVCCWNRILEDYDVIGLVRRPLGVITTEKPDEIFIKTEEPSDDFIKLIEERIKEKPAEEFPEFTILSRAKKTIFSSVMSKIIQDISIAPSDHPLLSKGTISSDDIAPYSKKTDILDNVVAYLNHLELGTIIEKIPCPPGYSDPCLRDDEYFSIVKKHIAKCPNVQTLDCPDCCIYLGFIILSKTQTAHRVSRTDECEPALATPVKMTDAFARDDKRRRYIYGNPLLAELICGHLHEGKPSPQPQEPATISIGGVCPLHANSTQKYYECKGIELGVGNEILGWSVQLGIGLQWPQVDWEDWIKKTGNETNPLGPLAVGPLGIPDLKKRNETTIITPNDQFSIKYAPELVYWGFFLFGRIHIENNKWLLDIQLIVDQKNPLWKYLSQREMFGLDVHWWAVAPQIKIDHNCGDKKRWPS